MVDEWNDSLSGDYLWSNVNFGEAVTDVMTPLSWSVLQHVFDQYALVPGYHTTGNIGGRPYLNISVFAAAFRAVGRDEQAMLEAVEGTMYMRLPDRAAIPEIPLSVRTRAAIALNLLRLRVRERRALKDLPRWLAENPSWCAKMRERIAETGTTANLLRLWQEEIEPHVLRGVWPVMASVSHYADHTTRLRRDLTALVGPDDADALISGVGGAEHPAAGTGLLASLGPVVGLASLARGELSREAYVERYGHRGPHEFELSEPRPAEDPHWIDAQLAQMTESPVDVAVLMEGKRCEFDASWQRLSASAPAQAAGLRARIDEVAPRARMREDARSEYTRDRWVARSFAVRAGELSGLRDDLFFLTLGEALGVLAGNGVAADRIAVRRRLYTRYSALPPYPSIILGGFDPEQWAAASARGGDARAAQPVHSTVDTEIVRGCAGSAGKVVGVVRRLDSHAEGGQLRPGEVLVTTQTDIAWTPVFPRAAAVVTDVGAPLSHAAIVARELGIPAVVGCVDATTRLRTGDRVRVDGGKGEVVLLARGPGWDDAPTHDAPTHDALPHAD